MNHTRPESVCKRVKSAIPVEPSLRQEAYEALAGHAERLGLSDAERRNVADVLAEVSIRWEERAAESRAACPVIDNAIAAVQISGRTDDADALRRALFGGPGRLADELARLAPIEVYDPMADEAIAVARAQLAASMGLAAAAE